ncbi:nephrin-like [Mytilus galloprovincialis]|uniref:nephrin-like n=1 Tax=Mytilus galloprovincialis TaxID=29158 RepID=UPI003F7BF5DB
MTLLVDYCVPDIPGNFSQRDSAFTSFTVQWDPSSGGGYKQTFYIQYRVQGSSEWTIVSAGEEDINEQRRRRTYEVTNLKEGKAYELRMYAENTAMKRSNFTDVLIVLTKSSGPKVSTTSSAVIGAVVGVVVTLVIVCASFIVILLIKRSQGKDKKEKNDKFYVNAGFQNIQNGDEYEEVENKFDVEHPQSSKTYETLGTKDKISVYDDLENTKGVTSSKSSMGVYEALGIQEKPSIYAKMENQKDLIKVEAVSGVKGSTVQMECPYKTPQGKRILWSKKTNPAIQYTDGTNINPNLPSDLTTRLSVTGDHTAGDYHLSISDVRESDEGTYECYLSGTAGSVTTLQLTVITNIPSSVSLENVGLDKQLNGIEGQNLIIRCSVVGGDPAPDVKLLISQSVVTVAKYSVQYTLSSVIRSYDDQNVQLKPYHPRFSSDSVNTEENKPLVISCTSTGSRPKASIYWLLGDGKTNITANVTQLSPSHDPTTDTYSVTSTLTYSMDRIYNGQYMICGSRNEATLEQGRGVETSKTLNITYAPDITVTSPIYTQNDAIRTVTCNPSGNPDSYIYHKWQHKSKYGDIIREFGGNKTLKLPDVPVMLRYQDGGEYVCTASNGIKDKDDELEKTGSGLVSVNVR